MKYAVITAIIYILIGLTSCVREKKTDAKIIEHYFDLEHFSRKKFKSENGSKINGADFKSEKFARSGEFAVELSKNHNQYALHYTFTPIELGDEIIVNVWRLKNETNSGILTISTGEEKNYNIRKSVKTEGDWELLEKHIKIKREITGDQLNIYVWTSQPDKVYFDDLNIKIIKNGGYSLVDHPDLEQIEIEISDKNFNKILTKKEEALKSKILISNDDDWVKATINWDGSSEKCKLRLKGDWTDHLIGQKWSFRVNVSGNKKVNGLTRFSIQNPLSRNYLSAWFVHQIFMYENVLTTHYDFINLKINNELKGLFSLEEHFTDELLIGQNRNKGVILKFDEKPLWLFRNENNLKQIGPIWYQSAEIIPFGAKNILNDKILRQEFLIGRDLLHRYQFSKGDMDQIFDIDKMAKFLALVDVFNAYHGLKWHNLRFYYNAETSRLEPIAYDLFTEYDPQDVFVPGFMGLNFLTKQNVALYYEFRILFSNKEFLHKYIEYLEEYTSPEFIDTHFKNNEIKLEFYENEIRKEYKFYRFDLYFYRENARTIREKLPVFRVDGLKMIESKIKNEKKINPEKYEFDPVNNASLKVYSSVLNNEAIIQYQNYYYKPLQIIGYIVSTDTLYPKERIRLNEYKFKDIIETKTNNMEFLIDKVIYQVVDEDSVYIQNVFRYRAPQ